MVAGFCKALQTGLLLHARANIAQDVNVKGTYLVTCEFLKRLEGGPGAVINVSSRSSYVTAPGMSAYQTSKSALNRSVCITYFYNILTS
jgi:NAD(P)-dependent dehydrogenase (short-subunit alcohol dehydrogenase family)